MAVPVSSLPMTNDPRPLKALILGSVAWNTMVYVDAFPDPQPQTLFARGSNETVGSSGAGKAMNLRSLGADATLWALVGDDDAGHRVRRAMERRGVAFIGVTDPEGTSRHINLIDDAGERISILARTGSDRHPVDVESVFEAAATADLASVTITNHCRPFLPMLRDSGMPIWVDLQDYDGINPHHDEFIEAADHFLMSSVAMPDWREFPERCVISGARVAICTHGVDGASGLTAADGWVDIPAVPVSNVVDTNGPDSLRRWTPGPLLQLPLSSLQTSLRPRCAVAREGSEWFGYRSFRHGGHLCRRRVRSGHRTL